jgi:hypothetical protein
MGADTNSSKTDAIKIVTVSNAKVRFMVHSTLPLPIWVVFDISFTMRIKIDLDARTGKASVSFCQTLPLHELMATLGSGRLSYQASPRITPLFSHT